MKAVCSQEQLRGAHCGTVKQTNKKGEQTADHTAELGEGPQVISYQINLR